MAFSRQDTDGFIKRFWRAADYGNGVSLWIYVTTDTPATAEVSGYFNDAVNELRVGDVIRLYQVAGLTDGAEIQSDLAGGITDVSEHIVVTNDGSTVDVTPDILGATITYTT